MFLRSLINKLNYNVSWEKRSNIEIRFLSSGIPTDFRLKTVFFGKVNWTEKRNKKLKLDQQAVEFRFGSHETWIWCDGIDIRKKNLILHETICSFPSFLLFPKKRAHQSEALAMWNFSRTFLVLVHVKRNRENRSTWCSRNQQGKKHVKWNWITEKRSRRFLVVVKGSYRQFCVCWKSWWSKKRQK